MLSRRSLFGRTVGAAVLAAFGGKAAKSIADEGDEFVCTHVDHANGMVEFTTNKTRVGYFFGGPEDGKVYLVEPACPAVHFSPQVKGADRFERCSYRRVRPLRPTDFPTPDPVFASPDISDQEALRRYVAKLGGRYAGHGIEYTFRVKKPFRVANDQFYPVRVTDFLRERNMQVEDRRGKLQGWA